VIELRDRRNELRAPAIVRKCTARKGEAVVHEKGVERLRGVVIDAEECNAAAFVQVIAKEGAVCTNIECCADRKHFLREKLGRDIAEDCGDRFSFKALPNAVVIRGRELDKENTRHTRLDLRQPSKRTDDDRGGVARLKIRTVEKINVAVDNKTAVRERRGGDKGH
jgi:hypothetical protein